MLPELAVLSPAQRRASRVVLRALSLAMAAWLGYAVGRGQSLAELADLYRDQTVMEYTVDTGQIVAQFARTGGDLKPLLRLPDGTALMDYSDWDYNATVIVDGQRYEFVRLVPSATADYARNRIVAGLASGDWVLSREITLTSAKARVQFTFLANKPIEEVRLTVPHANWYYMDVRLGARGFQAGVPRASRSEVETGLVRTPSYQVTLSASADAELAPDLARIGTTTPFGVQSVLTQYVLRKPQIGVYTPIAVETITWRKE